MKQQQYVWFGYKADYCPTDPICAFDSEDVAQAWRDNMATGEGEGGADIYFVSGPYPLFRKSLWRKFVDWCWAEERQQMNQKLLLFALFLFSAFCHGQEMQRPNLSASLVAAPTPSPCTVNCTSISYIWQYTNPPAGWVDCGPKFKISCFKGFVLTIVYNGTESWSFGTAKIGTGALSYKFVPGKELKNGTYAASLVAVGIDETGDVVLSLPATTETHYHGKQE